MISYYVRHTSTRSVQVWANSPEEAMSFALGEPDERWDNEPNLDSWDIESEDFNEPVVTSWVDDEEVRHFSQLRTWTEEAALDDR